MLATRQEKEESLLDYSNHVYLVRGDWVSVGHGGRPSVPKVQHKDADFLLHAGQAIVRGLFLASPLCPVYRHQYAEEVASSFCAVLMSEALFPRFLFRWKVMVAVGLHVAEFAALLQPAFAP